MHVDVDNRVVLTVFILSSLAMVGTNRPKYYTPNEVEIHNTLEDLWVTFLGNVYDLTPLCEKYKGELSTTQNTRAKMQCECVSCDTDIIK